MSEKEYTPKNILSLIAVGAVMIGGIGLITGCSSEPMSNEDFIAEVARCEANGYKSRTVTSTMDGTRTGVQCYVPYKPTPIEFKLDDGTRCIMISAPPATSRRAGASGISCNWDSAK